LLNAALTVPEGTAGGHAKIGWQPVTDAILRAVASQPGPIVFMPWGVHARAAVRRAGITDGRPHILCPSVHPMERRGAFVGSNPLGRANNRLRAHGLNPIDWSLG
jgi:uracil-DNA glycosylase